MARCSRRRPTSRAGRAYNLANDFDVTVREFFELGAERDSAGACDSCRIPLARGATSRSRAIVACIASCCRADARVSCRSDSTRDDHARQSVRLERARRPSSDGRRASGRRSEFRRRFGGGGRIVRTKCKGRDLSRAPSSVTTSARRSAPRRLRATLRLLAAALAIESALLSALSAFIVESILCARIHRGRSRRGSHRRARRYRSRRDPPSSKR